MNFSETIPKAQQKFSSNFRKSETAENSLFSGYFYIKGVKAIDTESASV